MMMFQFICDGCQRVESSMEEYKSKKVEKGQGEKRKVGEGWAAAAAKLAPLPSHLLNPNLQTRLANIAPSTWTAPDKVHRSIVSKV
uniref:Uncharacterized protein n=1 Tax=Oryza nivara TaxID=4536 RepID=A0A0E0IW34_ORYNI